MRTMSIEAQKAANGGGTATSLSCPYCGATFSRFYIGKYWKAYAMGRVAIDLRTHIYSCCLNYHRLYFNISTSFSPNSVRLYVR